MDRNIVYPGSIPLDTDMLNINRNTMVALSALISATLGTVTVYDGLTTVPTVPASLTVLVSPGSITALTALDQNAYGSLPADTTDPLMKMGVNLAATPFTLVAPTTSGQSVIYLIQAAFEEADGDPVVLPYYNAANPTQPYLGPGNNGIPQNTLRTQRVQLQAKAGVPATTGSQLPPTIDTGWLGLALVTIAYGQTQITVGGIAPLASQQALPYKLPTLRPGFSSLQAFTSSGIFMVPPGVTSVKATVIGGGGAGGTHSSLPAAGGGAGGQAVKIVTGLSPGSGVAVTVGGAGQSIAAPGNGGNGGTSSFGSFVSATGGFGGTGGTVLATNAGAGGGNGVGGDVNFAGAWGTDGVTVAPKGGDGGGPGGGRGSSGLIQAISAPGYGGGGGGGGASAAGGGGIGAQGGNGGPGIVIVEF